VWIWAMDKRSARLYALSGLIFGLAGLSKTLYLALFPLFIIWFWLSRRAGARDLLKAAVISGIVSMIVISPWSIRNYLVFREFIPVNLNNGYNLWVGNNPNATGSLFTRDRVGMWETMPEDMRDKLARMNDVEKNELFREKAVSYIKSHPDRFFKLIPQKLLFLWWFDPYMPTDFPGLREAIYLALLIPALIGMVISRRRFRGVSIFYMIYLELSFIYSIYYGSVRFRYLIEFSFILFASVTGIWIYDKLMALKQRKNINRRGR
jgi:4-amino-4-deoxy-L-arabinose transferase-like glycosyltransferase